MEKLLERRKELERMPSLIQLFSEIGIKLRRDTDGFAVANCPSPVHQLRSPSLRVKLSEPDMYWCDECGRKGNVQDYLEALFAPTSSEEAQATLVTSFLQQGKVAGERRTDSIALVNDEDEGAYRVYGCLVDKIDLSDTHFTYLLSRGLSGITCGAKFYGSLPVSRNDRIDICEKLISSGLTLDGIPGFFRIPATASDQSLHKRWCIGGDHLGRRSFRGNIDGTEVQYEIGGIVIPIRDAQWRIVGLEILNDLPPEDAPERLRALWPPRLSVLSSLPVSQGVESSMNNNARIHHSPPCDANNGDPDVLWITDWAIRADILAEEFNSPVMAIPTTNYFWEEISNVMLKFRRIIVAVSEDAKLHTARLCREAIRLGRESYVCPWEHNDSLYYEDLWLPYNHWEPKSYQEWWLNLPLKVKEEIERYL